MVFAEENIFEYLHPNFVWHGHHFIFGSADPRIRAVAIHLREQESEIFPDRLRIIVSQFLNKNGDWESGAIRFPQVELKAPSSDFDNIIKLIDLGVEIAKEADAFFENPQQWLELKHSQEK